MHILPEVNGSITNTLADTLNNTINTIVIDIVGRNQLEADFLVVFQVLNTLIRSQQFSTVTSWHFTEVPTASLHRIPAWTL